MIHAYLQTLNVSLTIFSLVFFDLIAILAIASTIWYKFIDIKSVFVGKNCIHFGRYFKIQMHYPHNLVQIVFFYWHWLQE